MFYHRFKVHNNGDDGDNQQGNNDNPGSQDINQLSALPTVADRVGISTGWLSFYSSSRQILTLFRSWVQ